MPENDKTQKDSGEANNENHRASSGGLWRICIGGGVLLAALLFISIYLPNLTERVKFFTVNALSLLVLVAIVVQAFIYRRQWDSMREQADIMRENIKETREMFYMANRAYFGIVGVGLTGFEAGNLPIVTIKVLNAGNTPAWKIRMHSRIDFTTEQLDYMSVVDRLFAAIEMSPIVPAKTDRDFTIEAPPGTQPLNPNQVLGVNLGALKMFVRGEILYEDISGETRTFPFCLERRNGIFGDCKRQQSPAQTTQNPAE